jgi:hypothetical protein
MRGVVSHFSSWVSQRLSPRADSGPMSAAGTGDLPKLHRRRDASQIKFRSYANIDTMRAARFD